MKRRNVVIWLMLVMLAFLAVLATSTFQSDREKIKVELLSSSTLSRSQTFLEGLWNAVFSRDLPRLKTRCISEWARSL